MKKHQKMETKGEHREYNKGIKKTIEIRIFCKFLRTSLDNGGKVLYNVGKNRKSIGKMGIIKKATFKIK